MSSGEGGSGVKIGGGGAYQKQFTHHMYLPMPAEEMQVDPAAPQDDPMIVDVANPNRLRRSWIRRSTHRRHLNWCHPGARCPDAPPVAEMPV